MIRRKIPAMACLLLVATTGLSACYDNHHPGRNRPPHGDHGHHDGGRGDGRGPG